MIKDLHENEFGCMEGIFYSDILGYDVKVMYKKNMVLVNQCVDIDLKRHQLIATDILHAMPVTIVPDCT